MLRVTTLYAHTAASTAQYYTRYLTHADGEQPGQWTGRQAGLLGLSGEMTTEQLELLLEGRDPITGSRLGYPLLDRVTTSGKVVHAVAGFGDHSAVADGASERLRALLGERAAAARVAVGVASLPQGAAVEVELTAALVRRR